MIPIPCTDNYVTSPRAIGPVARCCPSLSFYARTLAIVCRAAWRTRGGYSMPDWAQDSLRFMAASEACGLRFFVENIRVFAQLDRPCVIVANHMSTLETFCLPGLLIPIRPVSFVLKRSLTTYPIFRQVVNAIDPIVVDRKHPREDFTTVIKQGIERLESGRSVIVFPQTTRTPSLDRKAFNTIGVKLAKKAQVPLLPLALFTAAWGTGRVSKDFGGIQPKIPVRFRFGAPLTVHGTGKNEHEEIIEFIHWNLKGWRSM